MTPDQLFALPRDKAAQILRRIMPANVALQPTAADCSEGGCHGGDVAYDPSGRAYRYALLGVKDVFDPEFGYYQTGDPGWSTGISTGDYGPPGDTVYGRFEALYTADGNLVDVRFVQMERSDSWFAEHLDTIGPLAVRLVSMAAGAGWLPLPYAPPVEAAGLIPPIPAGASPVFDDFAQWAATDAADSVTQGFTDWQSELLADVGDYGYHTEWLADELVMPEGLSDPSMTFDGQPVPSQAFQPVADVTAADIPAWVEAENAAWEAWRQGLINDPPFGVTPVPASFDPVTPPTPPAVLDSVLTPAGTDFSFGGLLDDIEARMGQTLKVLAVGNKLREMVNAPRTAQPGGVSRTVLPDGRIAMRDPSGRVTYTRGGIRVGETATDGSVIINNGDNTFTRVRPGGATSIERYPGATSSSSAGLMSGSMPGGIPPALMLGALGLGVFLLMRRR